MSLSLYVCLSPHYYNQSLAAVFLLTISLSICMFIEQNLYPTSILPHLPSSLPPSLPSSLHPSFHYCLPKCRPYLHSYLCISLTHSFLLFVCLHTLYTLRPTHSASILLSPPLSFSLCLCPSLSASVLLFLNLLPNRIFPPFLSTFFSLQSPIPSCT